MKNSNHNLYIIFNNGFMSGQAIEHEVEHIQLILSWLNTDTQFCRANELVDRNRITAVPRKILKETHRFQLRSFRFIINKN